MASGKEKLDAFKFARRRMVANLLVPTPTGSDEGAPRPVKTFVASILIGVVAVAGMTVLGYLKPSAPSGWQNGLAVDGTTGAAYVDNGGELHPILNITSAQLLLGTTFTKYDVPDSVINAQKVGAPLGILGAPPVAPAASQVDLKSWTYCQQAENPDNQGIAGGQTVLEIGYGQGSTTAVTAGSGFIVHDSKGDNYLLAGNYSYRIAPIRGLEGTVSGDGNDDIAPAGTWVSDSFLNVFEAGAPIEDFPKVRDLGAKVTRLNQPANAVIGSYGTGPNNNSYYIETDSGLVQVTEFVYDLYSGYGELAANNVLHFTPALTQSEITNADVIDERTNPTDILNVGNTWPTSQITTDDLDAQQPGYAALCVNYNGQFDPSQDNIPELSLWYGAQLPNPTAGIGVSSGGGQYADSIDVLAGHGALSRDVANGNSANDGPIFLTLATGSRYQLETDPGVDGKAQKSALDNLQYKDVPLEPVPESWMALVPAGARLDPNAAGQPSNSE